MSRDNVWIVFTLAATNALDICAADIQNAYIQASTSEKHYVVCGPECGENQEKKALIRCALYGRKSAERDYWLHLRSCIEYLGFSPCKGDADIFDEKGQEDRQHRSLGICTTIC